MHKISTILAPIGTVLLVIGLVLVITGKGWTVLFCSIACYVVALFLHNIPIVYLTGLIFPIDESLTSKQATKIVEGHLHDRTNKDTIWFIEDFDYEVEQKRKKEKLERWETIIDEQRKDATNRLLKNESNG
jgi:hypothetical protein